MKSKVVAGIVIAVIVIAVVGGFLYTDSGALFGKSGTMKVGVADTPAVPVGVTGVFMTFDKISVHSNTSGWVNYSISKVTVNILNVTVKNPSFIGNLSLKAGRYTQIRLYLTNVSVVLFGVNTTFTLKTGFAIVNHPFVINSTGTLNMVVDFELYSSLNVTSHVFTPVVGSVTTSSSTSVS